MARYIDADLLLEELKVAFDAIYNDDGRLLYSDHICVGDDVEDLIKRVKGLPTADVVEVKHGKWIRVKELCGMEVLKCSICETEHPRFPTAYCCDCGAKMDGGKTE